MFTFWELSWKITWKELLTISVLCHHLFSFKSWNFFFFCKKNKKPENPNKPELPAIVTLLLWRYYCDSHLIISALKEKLRPRFSYHFSFCMSLHPMQIILTFPTLVYLHHSHTWKHKVLPYYFTNAVPKPDTDSISFNYIVVFSCSPHFLLIYPNLAVNFFKFFKLYSVSERTQGQSFLSANILFIPLSPTPLPNLLHFSYIWAQLGLHWNFSLLKISVKPHSCNLQMVSSQTFLCCSECCNPFLINLTCCSFILHIGKSNFYFSPIFVP